MLFQENTAIYFLMKHCNYKKIFYQNDSYKNLAGIIHTIFKNILPGAQLILFWGGGGLSMKTGKF